MAAKKLQQNELGAIPKTLVGKWVNGHGAPSADNLEKLKTLLDATMDFFHGDKEYYYGESDEEYARSAAHLALRLFLLAPNKFTEQQRERCRRVKDHSGAPRTLTGWKDFAEMVELALGSTPTTPKLVPRKRA